MDDEVKGETFGERVGEKSHPGRLCKIISRVGGWFLRRCLKRRSRWEVTAAKLDEQTKANLQDWARLMMASGEESIPRMPVVVVLTEEKREVVISLQEVAQGRWGNR